MGIKTTEKYIPTDETDLKKQLESYNIKDVEQQKNIINEQTGTNLKKAHRDTMVSLLSGYVLNKKIDITNITVLNGKISFDGKNFIETSLNDLKIEELKTGIKMDFITRYFPLENSGKKIESSIALSYKNDFEASSEVTVKKDLFNSDIEEFRKYIISKNPEYTKIYKSFSADELISFWAGVQLDLATNLKVIGIEETTSGMEKILGTTNLQGLNGKSLGENWKEANGLLKGGAILTGIYLLYKTITSLWNLEDNPIKGYFWKAMGVGLIGELIGQVYTGKSFIGEGLGASAKLLGGETNLTKLQKQHEKLNNNENKEIKDYTGLFLLTLGNKEKSDVLGNFGFINESSKDPLVQNLITKAKERGENVETIKDKLKIGREAIAKKTVKDLNLGIDLSIEDIMDISGAAKLSDKIDIVLERKNKIKNGGILKKIKDKGINSSEQIIISTLKINEVIESYIKTGNPVINIDLSPVGKNEQINIIL